ncbi:hypothetical protein NPIL_106111 [Nephila pilipes]|uniref:Uncharacterized protein n=1 Tax=Nephila pilipes TaxID=299642 RepID=A0A8X6UR09_NEPPI|nr:hypothetical protein NPIL_106111 [Nephila pilipes]
MTESVCSFPAIPHSPLFWALFQSSSCHGSRARAIATDGTGFGRWKTEGGQSRRTPNPAAFDPTYPPIEDWGHDPSATEQVVVGGDAYSFQRKCRKLTYPFSASCSGYSASNGVPAPPQIVSIRQSEGSSSGMQLSVCCSRSCVSSGVGGPRKAARPAVDDGEESCKMLEKDVGIFPCKATWQMHARLFMWLIMKVEHKGQNDSAPGTCFL